jgi:hypothetical protein
MYSQSKETILKYPSRNHVKTITRKTIIPFRWYLIFSPESFLVIYPDTHLPGSSEFKIKINPQISTGAERPNAFSIYQL